MNRLKFNLKYFSGKLDKLNRLTCSPKTIGLWCPWSRLQQMQASPETTWKKILEIYPRAGFKRLTAFTSLILELLFQCQRYLAKGENRFSTPAVDDKNAKDAPRNLNQHTGEKTNESANLTQN